MLIKDFSHQNLGIASLYLLLLAACGGGGAGEILALNREAPDEFNVISRTPLTVPPDFTLRPPGSTSGVQSELQPRNQAETVIFGVDQVSNAQIKDDLRTQGVSDDDMEFLERANALDSDPKIRAQLDLETDNILTSEDKLIERLMFWQDSDPGNIVDAQSEQSRIQEIRASGGNLRQEVPVITIDATVNKPSLISRLTPDSLWPF
ncbi:MAG: DUF3035 domain-containing protein [Pseudomonadota bacterium]